MASDRSSEAEGIRGVAGVEQSEAADSKLLSRRLARWASNLLVSGVILIVGLVFGREVIQWWRLGGGMGNRGEAVSGMHEEVGGNRLPPRSAADQLLAFGDFPHTLRRSELVGDLQNVLDHLRSTCRAVLAEPLAFSGEPGPAESRMLQGTAELTPVDERPGEWSIYELRAPLPMVVGIREAESQATSEVAVHPRRVVSWGLAFPSVAEAAENQTSWTLFTYAMGSVETTQHAEFSLPAPEFGRTTLSLHTDTNGTIRGFRGRGPAGDWMAFYDKWFEMNAWRAEAGWQSDGSAPWRRHFQHPTAGRIELVLADGGSGSIHALAVHSPQATNETR